MFLNAILMFFVILKPLFIYEIRIINQTVVMAQRYRFWLVTGFDVWPQQVTWYEDSVKFQSLLDYYGLCSIFYCFWDIKRFRVQQWPLTPKSHPGQKMCTIQKPTSVDNTSLSFIIFEIMQFKNSQALQAFWLFQSQSWILFLLNRKKSDHL